MTDTLDPPSFDQVLYISKVLDDMATSADAAAQLDTLIKAGGPKIWGSPGNDEILGAEGHR